MQPKRHTRALSERETDSVVAALADLIVAFLAMNGSELPDSLSTQAPGPHPPESEPVPEKEVLH